MAYEKNIAWADALAATYDSHFAAVADYQLPGLLKQAYADHGIETGAVLDLGCGTGRVQETLGPSYRYTGVDISSEMLARATARGYDEVLCGSIDEVLQNLPTKSFDHAVALSSLYFIPDVRAVVREIQRVCRCSFFVSLERFDGATLDAVRATTGVEMYNHALDVFPPVTFVRRHAYLWRRPANGLAIHGDVALGFLGGSSPSFERATEPTPRG